jgi:hypothetical protein
MGVDVGDESVARFHRDGYLVLREFFDPGPLAADVDDALAHGLRPDAQINRGSGGVGFLAVIMMCERTPISLELIDVLAPHAARLLGRAVLPGRAKGTWYFGSSGWHVDSVLEIPSVGFVSYLEPLTGEAGALRIRPGSHRGEEHEAVTIGTRPGDVIGFDEHVAHGSVGGMLRRQWRVDFIADPADEDEAALVKATFARIFDLTWDGGDDSDSYPSYGPYWQTLARPWHARLRSLGIYDLAERHRTARRDAPRGATRIESETRHPID